MQCIHNGNISCFLSFHSSFLALSNQYNQGKDKLSLLWRELRHRLLTANLGGGCFQGLLGEVVWPVDEVENQKGSRESGATQAVEGAGVAYVGGWGFGQLILCTGGSLGGKRDRNVS